MRLKDLIEQLQAIQREIGDGPPHEGIKGDVRVWVDYLGPAHPDLLNEDLEAELVEVHPTMAFGCGCPLDAVLRIVVKAERSNA